MSADFNMLNWFLGIVAALISAAVVGLWRLASNVSTLDERMSTWTRMFEDHLHTVNATAAEHGRRLNELEIHATEAKVHLSMENARRINEMETHIAELAGALKAQTRRGWWAS